MKKVLASVLAGSMVLGMASMASAASLVKTSKSTDYDFYVTAYDPTVYDVKAEEVVGQDLIDAAAAYKKAYNAVMKAKEADVDALIASLGRAYGDLYVEINLLDSAVKSKFEAIHAYDAPKDIADALDEKADDIDVTLGNCTAATMSGKAAFAPALASLKAKIAAVKALYPAPADVEDVIELSAVAIGTGTLNVSHRDSFKLEDNAGNEWNLYNYGVDDTKEVIIRLAVPAKEDFRVDVASGKVTMTRKKVKTQGGADIYDIKVKAAAGVRDFELDDYKIEFDLHDSNLVFFVEGKVAYSDYREVAPDERYINKKSTHIEDHTDGCVYDFNEVIDEETRIICNDYVDLLFKGNYGTDFENLRVMTDDIKEVEDFFQDYDIDYYDFIGTPKFAKDITVRVDADSDSYIYEFDKKTGDVVDITDECDYTSDGWTFKRKNLKTYVVLEEPYEGGNVRADKEPVDDEPTEPDDTDATGSKPNPGTGAMPF